MGVKRGKKWSEDLKWGYKNLYWNRFHGNLFFVPRFYKRGEHFIRSIFKCKANRHVDEKNEFKGKSDRHIEREKDMSESCGNALQ